ncbi:hypothetical protein ACWGOE_05885 [Leucobacter chromiiresistens]
MQDDEPGAATAVHRILDEVIAAHANRVGTHYGSCYVRHAGCLAVRPRDELGKAGQCETQAKFASRGAKDAHSLGGMCHLVSCAPAHLARIMEGTATTGLRASPAVRGNTSPR